MKSNVMTTNEIRKNKLNRRRNRIRRKRIECVLNAITMIGIVYLMGTVGGCDLELLTIKETMVHILAAVGIITGSIAVNIRV